MLLVQSNYISNEMPQQGKSVYKHDQEDSKLSREHGRILMLNDSITTVKWTKKQNNIDFYWFVNFKL